jgi:hypothetical protein
VEVLRFKLYIHIFSITYLRRYSNFEVSSPERLSLMVPRDCPVDRGSQIQVVVELGSGAVAGKSRGIAHADPADRLAGQNLAQLC